MGKLIRKPANSQPGGTWLLQFAVVAVIAACALAGGCTPLPPRLQVADVAAVMEKTYGAEQPELWAESLPGVMRYLDYPAGEKQIALTLDACGSTGDSYDRELIDFLVAERIAVTLFINSRWIDKNPVAFKSLASNPLFDIQNHGLNHLPASVNGRSVYGLTGTANITELVEEVAVSQRKITELTGRAPTYYRSGTAYYDEVAVKVVYRLGEKVAGFSVLGDAGTTYSAEQIEQTLALVQPNDIIIAHMNHPERQTADGLIPALTRLKSQGFNFVTLHDAPTRFAAPPGYAYTERNLALDINVYPLDSPAHKLPR